MRRGVGMYFYIPFQVAGATHTHRFVVLFTVRISELGFEKENPLPELSFDGKKLQSSFLEKGENIYGQKNRQ